MLKLGMTKRLFSLLAVSILIVACGGGGGGGNSGGGGGGGNTDTDNDGVANTVDNCPTVVNVSQADNDADGAGDACDADDDNDTVADAADNCPLVQNADQADNEGDGVGDECDADDDNDGVGDTADNCPLAANDNQADLDSDNAGDICDDDDDGDGVSDTTDNCPVIPNMSQADNEGDGLGDDCDADDDNDGVNDADDNSQFVANPDQTDTDMDGTGDVSDVDDDNDGVADGDDNCPLTANPSQADTDGDGFGDACDSATNITVSGKITFDNVPHNPTTNGLNYAATTADPVRNVQVQILEAATMAVLATVETDDLGDYSAQAPINTNIFVRARAELLRSGTPGWDVRIVDNTQSNALYVLESASANTGTADLTQDLHAASGWGGASYSGIRAAAPFAALDAITDAMNQLLMVDPTAQFPALVVKWSPDNNTASGDEDIGEIGNTFFRRNLDGSREILLLGAEDEDTDEYDHHVVIHEWGHYFEDVFARADTIGGGHSPGDRLDPRVAFSEGWGYAYAGIATGNPVTRDALGFGQASGFAIDVEENNNLNPGWFSEGSAQSIIYDLVDTDVDGADAISLGFGPVYDLLSGQMASSVPPLTIFSFIDFLKQENPSDSAGIDALVNAQSIDSNSIDQYATGETHDEGRGSDVLPVYTTLTVDAAPITLCTLAGEDAGDFGTYNKLSVRRFMRLNIPADGDYRFVASGPSDGDPDLVLHSGGFITAFELVGQTETSPPVTINAGSYVVEVYEFSNLTEMPRGDTCIDVSVQSL